MTGPARINLLHEDAEQRERRLAALRQEAENEHPFQPSITDMAESQGGAEGDVFKKLYDAAEAKLKQRNEALEQQPLDQECTFQPKLLTAQRAKSASRATRGPRTNVQARLMMYLDSQEEKRRQLEEEAAERFAAETTFQPNVKLPAGMVVEGTVWERLTRGVSDKTQARLAALEAEANAELTFQPQLAARSGTPSRRSSKPVAVTDEPSQRSVSRGHRDRRDSAATSNGAVDKLTRSKTDDIFERLNQEAEARAQKAKQRESEATTKRPDSGARQPSPSLKRRDETPLRARGSSRGPAVTRAGSQGDVIKSLRRPSSQPVMDSPGAVSMRDSNLDPLDALDFTALSCLVSLVQGEVVDGSLEDLNTST